MSLIAKSTIQEVNSRLDAIAAVGDYVRLEKKGGRWWARCPFHGGGQERTPSFTVDPDLKTYYCFGCGKGGGVIGFVMEMDKISYPEAIKNLARKLGIEVVYEDGGAGEPEQDNSRKEELFELYRRTTVTFQHFLREKPEGKDAMKYISDRGISEEMIGSFRLGLAPADRDFLYNFLKQKGYSEDFLDKSGLFSSHYRTMPLFSGRLMFPIADRQARIAAFGGRALPGILQRDGREPPKYINSPETEIYKKGQTLFAIDLALPEIRRSKVAYLAEGYMDVIALHQAGITNTLAPLGTAFTGEQANLLRRWAEKVVLVFDTDEAGLKAAYKAIITCRKNGLSCALAQMRQAFEEERISPDYTVFKDPADILQKFGPEILNKIMKYTINDFEYLISRGKSQYDVSVPSGKTKALAFLFPYLETLDSEIERDDCIALAADSFGVERAAVQKGYSMRKREDYVSRTERLEKQPDVLQNAPIRMNGELFLLTVVSANRELYPKFRAALEIKEIDDPAAKELFIAMEECFVHDESGIDSLLARIGNEALRNFIASRGMSPEFKGGIAGISVRDPGRLMEDGINSIRKKSLLRRLTEIGAELRMGERSGGIVDIEELLAEKMSIDSQIRKLEGK
ncbi:MAG: DNA primase [Treponema sp.]|jgi:DNA primase|nr:DNA primase [Treponema sp.]